MVEKDDVRKAGDYTIKQSVQIGEKEIVIGENMQDKDGRYYLVANYEENDIFARYVDVLVGGDYIGIVKTFTDRINAEVDRLQEQMKDYPSDIITMEQCESVTNKDFTNEIVVIRADYLRPEYRNAACQIVLCTGGNGAKPTGLGTSVFCKGFHDNEECRYRRAGVLGILKPEHYPEWLKDKLAIQNNPLTFEYGGYHFLPVGVINRTKTHEEISKKIASDRTMGIWSAAYNKMYGKGKVEYTHKGFYSACGDIFCDVFKCLENGKYYMPGVNELFLYEGKFKPYVDAPHKNKGKKEVER